MLVREQIELYRGGGDWERELALAIAGKHAPPRRSLIPHPSPMMMGAGGAAPFTFGYDGAPALTNEDWGGFPGLGLGNVKTAGASDSGTASKLWVRAGSTSGISADVRIIIYPTTGGSHQNWATAPVAQGVISGGVAANATASVSVTPFAIVNGTEYALAVQASAGPVNFASVGSVLQNWWYVDSYADGAMNPGPNPVNGNGFNRAPAVWCSN